MWWEKALDYGIAGLALAMMYSITFNHLRGIQTTLTEIKVILSQIQEKGLTLS